MPSETVVALKSRTFGWRLWKRGRSGVEYVTKAGRSITFTEWTGSCAICGVEVKGLGPDQPDRLSPLTCHMHRPTKQQFAALRAERRQDKYDFLLQLRALVAGHPDATLEELGAAL